MPEKKKRRITTYLAAILFLLGLGFLAIEPLQNYLIDQQSKETLTVDAADFQENQSHDGNYDFSSVEEVSVEDVLKIQFSSQELPVIGRIAVPEVGLNLPVLKGLSNEHLLTGAGTMKPDQKMGEGNYALASHNMTDPSLLFAPLHRAEIGMNVYLTDGEQFYVYEIKQHKIIEPTEVSVIEDTDQSLVTLITCNVDGNKRLLTQGVLIETVPVDESDEIAAYFNL